MIILALILYCITGALSWVVLGGLLAKIDPSLTVVLFSLLFSNFILKQILLNGEKK
jgi:hypothetical protein